MPANFRSRAAPRAVRGSSLRPGREPRNRRSARSARRRCRAKGNSRPRRSGPADTCGGTRGTAGSPRPSADPASPKRPAVPPCARCRCDRCVRSGCGSRLPSTMAYSSLPSSTAAIERIASGNRRFFGLVSAGMKQNNHPELANLPTRIKKRDGGRRAASRASRDAAPRPAVPGRGSAPFDVQLASERFEHGFVEILDARHGIGSEAVLALKQVWRSARMCSPCSGAGRRANR